VHCSLVIIIKNIKPRLIDCKHIEVISVCQFECVTYCFFCGCVTYCYFRQRVLVIGGGGAVGLAAVQFAVAAGCGISATCGAQSMERVVGAGAEQAIDYTTEVKSLGCSCLELCC
jgi:NADPH:quinone reductase-like Zn-dependent oxidoreductase